MFSSKSDLSIELAAARTILWHFTVSPVLQTRLTSTKLQEDWREDSMVFRWAWCEWGPPHDSVMLDDVRSILFNISQPFLTRCRYLLAVEVASAWVASDARQQRLWPGATVEALSDFLRPRLVQVDGQCCLDTWVGIKALDCAKTYQRTGIKDALNNENRYLNHFKSVNLILKFNTSQPKCHRPNFCLHKDPQQL